MLFVRRLYLPLLLLLCALWAFNPLDGGDDFWAHAAIGRIVLDQGHIPRSTVYLWSADVPWVFHAYGSGIIYALLLRLGGPWLALCLNFALAVAPLLLVWRRAKERAGQVPLMLAVGFVPALWFSSVRWRLRPEGFTVLFLTLLLLFLSSEKRKKWHFFAVAGMFALWPNLHGGVLIGILVLWTTVVAQALLPTVQKIGAIVLKFPGALVGHARSAFLKAPRETDSQRFFRVAPASEPEPVQETEPRFDPHLLVLAVACSVLPLVCNPWGLHYASVFGGTAATSNHISEWRHFWAFPAMNMQVAWGLCGLWVVAFIVWCLDKQKRAAIGAGLLLLGALWIQARRQMWLTSTTCLVALAQSAALLGGERMYARLKRQPNARLDRPMKLIAEVGVVLVLVSACIVNFPSRGFRAVAKAAPVGMSRFLVSPQAPKGRIFNDYEYSAALEWFLNGRRPLYIDLINAYPPKIFNDWFDVAHANAKGLALLDAKKVDVVALRPIAKADPKTKKNDDPIFGLGQYLDTSPAWKQVYKGDDGHVWARKKPFHAPEKFDESLRMPADAD